MNIPEYDVTGRKVMLVGAARGIGKGIRNFKDATREGMKDEQV